MKISESMQARIFLERRRCGASYGHLWKWAVKSHVRLVAGLCVLAAVWWYGVLTTGPFLFVAGLVAGALARDFGWFRAARRSWPFCEKVIDWAQVEAMAQEREQRQEGNRGMDQLQEKEKRS